VCILRYKLVPSLHRWRYGTNVGVSQRWSWRTGVTNVGGSERRDR